ncbi:MAG: restriction endonuclease subunit S, partial [Myxococcota bacterium]
GNINQHSVKIKLKDKADLIKIDPHYIESFFNTGIAGQLVFREVTGGTRPAVDYTAIKSLQIPLPPIETQRRIAAEVKRRMDRAQQLEREAALQLQEAKKQAEAMILGGDGHFDRKRQSRVPDMQRAHEQEQAAG